MFAFDNIAPTLAFGGAPLDKVLTCGDTVDLRILGKTEMERHQWRAIVMATGNNVSYRGDTSRRVLVSRLEPSIENPEARTDFKHLDLRGWVRQERRRLAVAALTLLRAYFVAGRPAVVPAKGSFEAWSKIVPSAITWAGGPDASTALPAEDADEEKDTLRDLLAVWPEGKAYLAKELFDRATKRTLIATGGEDEAEKAFGDALRGVFNGAETAKAAAGALRRARGRVVAGKRLDSHYETHDKIMKWSATSAR